MQAHDDHPRTVGEALRRTRAALASCLSEVAGIVPSEAEQQARAEAEIMLSAVLGADRSAWLTRWADPLPLTAWATLEAWLARRAHGEPLQYIVGKAWFYGREFSVRHGVLVPRPETEWLAEAAIRWIQAYRPDARVVDLGTGSGVLAITIALECAGAEVTGIDISEEALTVARDNAARFGAQRVRWLREDGRTWLQHAADPARPHVLVSNPPYIPSADVARLAVEVWRYEPRLALDGGPDGLDWYRALQAAGPDRLAPGPAAVFCELGVDQAEAVLALFRADTRWHGWEMAVLPDLRGIPRVLSLVREV